MSDEKKSEGSDRITRRGFVTHAAAAGVGGGLVHIVGGKPGGLRAEPAPTSAGGVEGASGESRATAEIPRRPFGNTGTDIPIVGLGAGSRFYGSTPDDESAAELIRAAIDRGVAFVETGANYGPDGLSEKRIGLAMKTHREGVFLETKVDERGYDGAMREMERSLTRMNTDRLDLVLHHLLSSEEMVAEVAAPNGAEKAIRQMMDQGVVKHRGFSAHLPSVALAGIERLDPQAIQLPINAVRVPDFEAEVVPAAAEAGIAIIAMKTCGNGFFFPANATTPDRIERYGPPPGAWDRWDLPTWNDYIHYVLSLPVSTATIGIDSFFTLEGVVAAASSYEPLSPNRMASIHERAQIFSSTGYWIPRDARRGDG
ncbi:MAG: aldo/keto reductase [Gemmatimonadetes bacterium]|nr:aldo/keto reductase [Gemmatimonadota bacterium]NNM06675.1 aldo/keto reductase [Gemmatimonadota bacterium]